MTLAHHRHGHQGREKGRNGNPSRDGKVLSEVHVKANSRKKNTINSLKFVFKLMLIHYNNKTPSVAMES